METPILAILHILSAKALQTDNNPSCALQSLELREGQTIRIGRASSNDLVLQDPNVSRFHAILSASSLGIVLSDLSSLNGSLLNGKRTSTPVSVHSGDNIRIGETEFQIEFVLGHPLESHGGSLLQTEASGMATRMVTILLADVCGYTTLTHHLPADPVARMLNQWLRLTSEIIRQHGGEVDKFIGDCVMAFWQGGTETSAELAIQSVKAGLEIQRATNLLATGGKWHYQEEYPWRCRVVFNSGAALVGAVGGSASRTFTVLGDEINLAFKLEQQANAFNNPDLLLSSSTAKLVEAALPIRYLGSVNVEGRAEAVAAYTVD